jgi:hypothetical protein
MDTLIPAASQIGFQIGLRMPPAMAIRTNGK